MNLLPTPGRTKIVPVDPNNQRVDVDSALVTSIISTVTAAIPASVTPSPGTPSTVTIESQLVIYANDPNVEGLKPSDQTKPALAYSLNTANPTMLWNTSTRVWQ